MKRVTVIREPGVEGAILIVKNRRETITNQRHLVRRLTELREHGYRVQDGLVYDGPEEEEQR